MRKITAIMAMLLLVALGLPANDAFAQGARRPTPNKTDFFPFFEGETVTASEFKLYSGWQANGACTHRGEAGLYRDGVANPASWDSRASACEFFWPEEIGTEVEQYAPPAAEAPSTNPHTVNGLERRSGAGWVEFADGEAAVASEIVLQNGTTYASACYLEVAPSAGKARETAVNPWWAEVGGKAICGRDVQPTMAERPAQIAPSQAIATPAVETTVNGRERRDSGGNHWMPFTAGEAVVASEISLDNRESYPSCYLEVAPSGGHAREAAINPRVSEIAGKPICGRDVAGRGLLTVNGRARVPTGYNQNLRFQPGDIVFGAKIVLDGGFEYTDGCVLVAGVTGYVHDGVRNPWVDEDTWRRPCPPAILVVPSYGGVFTPHQQQQPERTVNNRVRRDSNGNNWIGFSAGEAVLASEIETGGQTYGNCYMAYAQNSGRAREAAINPRISEIAGKAAC